MNTISLIFGGAVILCIFVFILYHLAKKRRPVKIKKKYEKNLNAYNAKCALYCDYIQGINKIEKKTPCVLYAGNDFLKIVTSEKSLDIINLNISHLQTFQYFNRDKIIPYMYELYLVNLAAYKEFIIIKYLTDKETAGEIFFSLDIKNNKRVLNEYCRSRCDIFDFVNERIIKPFEQLSFF